MRRDLIPAHYILLPKERHQLGKVVVAVGCVYELAALWSRLPTITDLATRPRRHPFGWLVTVGCTLVTLVHFRPRVAVVVVR